MNNLNLHNRLPKDLPDKETIEDILLELKDTHKFNINWIDLNHSQPRSDDRDYSFIPAGWRAWRANGRSFDNWIEKGEVVTCEMDPINYSLDFDTMSYATVKETRYDILRHPIRLQVRSEAGILSLNHSATELIRTSTDVYLRLKDYLGPDVIQSQNMTPSFMIDFMLTSCKIK
jgi:hypothetical protein